MRFIRLMFPLLCVSALAACANGTGARLTSGAVPAAAAPEPIADHDWFLHRDGQELTLAYGVAESDDLKLQMICQAGAGALELGAIFDKPSRELLLESGADSERYPATSEPAAIHDGQYVSASASAKDPVFQRFRRLGWIAVWQGEEREALAAHPASRPDIERFFADCG